MVLGTGVVAIVEFKWCKSTDGLSTMRVNSIPKAMVETQPRKNGEKTTDGKLEGASQSALKSRELIVRRAGGRSKKSGSQEVVERLVTRLKHAPRFPPMFDDTPLRCCRRRFVSAENVAITNQNFTLSNGHRQFLVVTDTAGTAVCWVDVWRIKSVSVWCINYVDNATTVTIRPLSTDLDTNNYNDREATYSCSSRSEAEPGSMKIVPARDTPLGSWHKTSTVNATGVLFGLNVNYGGASSGNWATVTIDIEFEYVENMVGSPQGYSVSTSTLTPGTLGGSNLFTSALLLQSVNQLF